MSTPAHQGAWGVPAVQPQAALAASTGPHFTAADVDRYIAANPPPFTVKGTAAPTVVSVTFETASKAEATYPGSLAGTTASSPVCVVIVSGTFLNTYGGPYGVTVTSTPFNQGVMIFNAYTGNLLADNLG
jgi:hypothetical protein